MHVTVDSKIRSLNWDAILSNDYLDDNLIFIFNLSRAINFLLLILAQRIDSGSVHHILVIYNNPKYIYYNNLIYFIFVFHIKKSNFTNN